eukprot:TRINITY_DN2479_c0_g1_i1.p2 TRINITY_DN2479_c0_g1~~TRINITY_DN2479_c0_g1_i1.p2  ORF type:complete len:117 (-),score=33.40 TRINITY_DN2479_c0_g1_i1:84-434(-)
MSSSSKSIDIPAKLRLQHPDYTISQSVGGTVYAMTPGGTRMVYNREALMTLSKSPLARDRPLMMPDIPGVTSAASPLASKSADASTTADSTAPADAGEPVAASNKDAEDDAIFQME